MLNHPNLSDSFPRVMDRACTQAWSSVVHAFEGTAEPAARATRYAEGFTTEDCVWDLGCGTGLLLQALADRGIHSVGVEVDFLRLYQIPPHPLYRTIRADWRDLLQVRLAWQGQDVADFPRYPTALALIHVVEHSMPEQVFYALWEWIHTFPTIRRILLVTPNFSHSGVRDQGFWLDPTHVRPYPLPLLHQMVEALGFVVQASGLDAADQDAYVWAQRSR